MVSFTRKQNVNFGKVIGNTVKLVLVMFVGGKIIQKVADVMDINSDNYFYDAMDFLGVAPGSGSGGMIGVIGLVAVANLVMNFVDISF